MSVPIGIRNSYQHMIGRCYDPKHVSYKNYGAKGVTVCEEWRLNFTSFLNWALENGWEKGFQIDKDIKGNGKFYSPNTCCWVTRSVNSKHRSTSVKFDVNGKKINLIDISQELGIDRRTITKRLNLGWSKDKAISTHLRGSELKNFGAYKNGELIYTFKTVDEAAKMLGGDRKKYWRILTGRTKNSKTDYEFKFLKNDRTNKNTIY